MASLIDENTIDESETVGEGQRPQTSLLGGYSFLVGSFVGAQLLGLVGLAIVSRRVGPTGLGNYAYAASIAAYFTLPLLPGFALLGTRRVTVATNPERPRIVFEFQALCAANGLLALVVLVLGRSILTPNPQAAALLPILALTALVNAVNLDWALQGLREVRKLAWIRFSGQAVYLAVILALLASGNVTVTWYAWANLIGFAVAASLDAVFVWRKIGRPPFRGPAKVFAGAGAVRKLLSATIPLATSAVMLQIYLYAAVILLGVLDSASAVGLYSTASRLPIAMLFLSALWGSVFFPHAADTWHRDRKLLLRHVGHFATLAAILFLPAVLIAFSIGSDALAALFGEPFRPGGTTFALLVGFAALAMINVNITNLMLAAGDDRGLMLRAVAAAFVCVGLCFVFIPPWGPAGAAAASILAESLAIGLALIRVSRVLGRIPPPEPRRIVGSVVAAILTVITLQACSDLQWILRGAAGGLVYFATAIGLGALRRSDLRTPD